MRENMVGEEGRRGGSILFRIALQSREEFITVIENEMGGSDSNPIRKVMEQNVTY